MVDSLTATLVAAVFAVIFWFVALIFFILLCRNRRRIRRAISPRKARRPKRMPVYFRTTLQSPPLPTDDPERDSWAGDDSDEFDDYERGQDDRVYMNQLPAQTGARAQSYNSLRSENLQLELFNKSFKRPQRDSPVVYQRGKEIIRVVEQSTADVSYENTAVPPPPISPPDAGPLPPPPTSPPPPDSEPVPPPPTVPPPGAVYENFEDGITPPNTAGGTVALAIGEYENFNHTDEATDNRTRPMSENPECIDESTRAALSGIRPVSLSYENPYVDGTARTALDSMLGAVSIDQDRTSFAYEDPTDYSEGTPMKQKKIQKVDSVNYEDLEEDLADLYTQRRRNTVTAAL